MRAPAMPVASPYSPPPGPSGLGWEAVSEGDFAAMAELRAEALRESLERLGRFDPVRVRERLRDAFVPEGMRHIVRDGERIGYLTLLPRVADGTLRLHHLYLRPGAQNAGAGSWAMAWVKARARERGCDVTLCALKRSDANRFYLRHGFRQVADEPFDLEYRWSPSWDGPAPGAQP